MQKKLLPLAIAGVLAAPGAAFADVSAKDAMNVDVYGKFHASWDFVDTGATGTASADESDDNTAAFRASRLGFKGSESIARGLRANWQVETLLDTGDDAMELRDTYVGLAGEQWGEIRLGKHDTPYKMGTAALDLFADTVADYNNIIGSASNVAGTVGANADINNKGKFDVRAAQSVIYLTPEFSGLQGAISRQSYSSDEPSGADETEVWSVMARYGEVGKEGPFASLAYETQSGNLSSDSVNDEVEAFKVGAGYTFGDSRIGLIYEDIESDAANSALSREAFHVNFAQTIGPNVLKLAYSKADDSDAGSDGADSWTIGIDHNISKRTKLYALYTALDNEDSGLYGLTSGSNSASYTPTVVAGDGASAALTNLGAAGDEVDAFSVGIIHSF